MPTLGKAARDLDVQHDELSRRWIYIEGMNDEVERKDNQGG